MDGQSFNTFKLLSVECLLERLCVPSTTYQL